MIRKVLLTTVAMVAISGTAFAADLPSRRAPPVFVPPPVPLFSWTGFYIGGQFGYGFGSDRAGVFGPAGAATYGIKNASAIGGGHIGYNYELGNTLGAGVFGGGLVVGLEADVDGTNNGSNVTFGAFTDSHRTEVEGSARGRIGIAVDRALFYATGGAAIAQFNDSYFVAIPGGVAGVAGGTTRVGYTVGGGIEYAITPQWSLRAEYRYSDFGTYRRDISAAFGAAAGTVVATNRPIEQRAQVGFSYKFDTPVAAPVVARY